MRNRVTVRQISNPFKYLLYNVANPGDKILKRIITLEPIGSLYRTKIHLSWKVQIENCLIYMFSFSLLSNFIKNQIQTPDKHHSSKFLLKTFLTMPVHLFKVALNLSHTSRKEFLSFDWGFYVNTAIGFDFQNWVCSKVGFFQIWNDEKVSCDSFPWTVLWFLVGILLQVLQCDTYLPMVIIQSIGVFGVRKFPWF